VNRRPDIATTTEGFTLWVADSALTVVTTLTRGPYCRSFWGVKFTLAFAHRENAPGCQRASCSAEHREDLGAFDQPRSRSIEVRVAFDDADTSSLHVLG
jgi:hypothetical protein